MTKSPDRFDSTAQRGADLASAGALRKFAPVPRPAGLATKLSFTLVLGLLPALALHAQETTPASDKDKNPQTLSKTVVSGVTGPETAPSADLAIAKLAEVPGAVSLITSDQVEKGRVGTVSDIFAFQPGVFAQTAQGSDGIKISIRGSGINRGTGFFRSGTDFYFDGLPITGAGGTPYELFEPLGLNYTEVLLGGNAFDFGSVALGGAINYVTHTGYDASPGEVRFEAGSFGYFKGQVASGQVNGPFDYYVSLTASHRDGYQALSRAESYGIASNFGYKINFNVETRFYLRFRRTDNQTPGALTQQQIDTDASQANPANVKQNASRLQPGSTWVANKTTIKIDSDSALETGVVYHNYPIKINPNPAPGSVNINGDGSLGAVNNNAVLSNSSWWYADIDLSLKYTRTDTVAGRPSNSSLEATTTFHPGTGAGVDVYANNPNITTGLFAFGTLLKRADYNGSSDTVYRIGNDTEVADKLWLTTGAGYVVIDRATNFEYVNPGIVLPTDYVKKFSRTENHFALRGGLRYEVDPDWTFYGNVTQTVEPPNDWAPSGGSAVGTARHADGTAVLSNGFVAPDIKDQTATTFEVGTRFKKNIFLGSLALYHSDVKNELLTVQVDPGPPPVTRETNGTPTKKEGIEAGLDTILWHTGDAKDPFKAKEQLLLRQSFTLNSFHFKNDPTFHENELPGIPRRFYQVALVYAHASGLYTSVDLQHADSTFVDYANTFSVHPYTIYGFKIGYDSPQGHWQTYLDFRNLTNKGYTASVSPIYDTTKLNVANPGVPTDQRVLSPGDGFGVFGGVSYKF